MDITLQIMAYPPTHDLSYNLAKEARRYKRGDIVAVYLRSEVVEPPHIGSRMVFIHIIGVPVTAIQKAKKLMDAHFDSINIRILLKRRRFNIDPQSLPVSVRNQLIANREITVTWTQAKPYLIDAVTGLTVIDGDLI